MPVMTIDRLLTTKEACADYIGWIGSDFVEQGRRAADAMIRETGGEANARHPRSAPPASTSPPTATTASWSASTTVDHRHRRSSPSRPPTTSGQMGQTVTEQLIAAEPGDRLRSTPTTTRWRWGPWLPSRRPAMQPGRRQDHHHRRHPGGGPGDHRRLDQRRHRVEPEVRAAGLPGVGGLLQWRRRSRGDDHLGQGVHHRERRGRTGQRVLIGRPRAGRPVAATAAGRPVRCPR